MRGRIGYNEGEIKIVANTTVEEYERAINPHIDWILEQIKKSKDGYIIMKISDVKKTMGIVFCEKSDVSIYMTLRHVLFKKGIFVGHRKHKDGSQMLMMRKTIDSDYIDDILYARRKLRQQSAENAGFETFADMIRDSPSQLIVKKGTMEEDIFCSQYLGKYIEEKYVMKLFPNAVPFKIEYKENEKYGSRKTYDWICSNGLKIKHIAACSCISNSRVSGIDKSPIPYWQYHINYNDDADVFMLTAWDSRESLEPKYVWVINGKEKILTQASYKPFCERASWTVYATRKGIARMDKYEATKRLGQLTTICNLAKTELRELKVIDEIIQEINIKDK